LGGLFAGFLGLDLRDEPLKSWLDQSRAEAGVRFDPTEDNTSVGDA
jgi:hypothetical protein